MGKVLEFKSAKRVEAGALSHQIPQLLKQSSVFRPLVQDPRLNHKEYVFHTSAAHLKLLEKLMDSEDLLGANVVLKVDQTRRPFEIGEVRLGGVETTAYLGSKTARPLEKINHAILAASGANSYAASRGFWHTLERGLYERGYQPIYMGTGGVRRVEPLHDTHTPDYTNQTTPLEAHRLIEEAAVIVSASPSYSHLAATCPGIEITALVESVFDIPFPPPTGMTGIAAGVHSQLAEADAEQILKRTKPFTRGYW